MPGVDRDCTTHHACDCIQAKLDQQRKDIQRLTAERAQDIKNWEKAEQARYDADAKAVGILFDQQCEEVARLTEERDRFERQRNELQDQVQKQTTHYYRQREDIARLLGLVECLFCIKPCSVALKDFRGSWCRNCHVVGEIKERYGDA